MTGLKQARAEQALRDAGFEPRVVETTDTTEPRGHRGRAEPAGRPGGRGGLDGHDRRLGLREEPSETPSETPTESPSPTETTSPVLPTDTTDTGRGGG